MSAPLSNVLFATLSSFERAFSLKCALIAIERITITHTWKRISIKFETDSTSLTLQYIIDEERNPIDINEFLEKYDHSNQLFQILKNGEKSNLLFLLKRTDPICYKRW